MAIFHRHRWLSPVAAAVIAAFPAGEATAQRVEVPAYHTWSVGAHGQLYLASDDAVRLRDTQLRPAARWDAPGGAQITSIDARDLRLLVFFRGQRQVLFLDHNLAAAGHAADLDAAGLRDVTAVCASERGGFWAADRHTNTVTLVGRSFAAEYAFPLNLWCDAGQVARMAEYGRSLWLLLDDGQWLQFDLFGQLLARHPLPGAAAAQIGERIARIDGGQLLAYDWRTRATDTLAAPPADATAAFERDGRLFLFGERFVEIR